MPEAWEVCKLGPDKGEGPRWPGQVEVLRAESQKPNNVSWNAHASYEIASHFSDEPLYKQVQYKQVHRWGAAVLSLLRCAASPVSCPYALRSSAITTCCDCVFGRKCVCVRAHEPVLTPTRGPV